MTALQKLYVGVDEWSDEEMSEEGVSSMAALPQLRALGLYADGYTSPGTGVRHVTQLAPTLEELVISSEGDADFEPSMIFSATAQLTGLTSLV